MKRIIGFSFLAILFAACSKDNFNTVPTVKINSFGPDEVFNGSQVQLVATVTDKEGDVQDSVLIVRNRFAGTIVTTDTIRTTIKALGSPVKDKIELQVTFLYGKLDPGRVIPLDLVYDFDRQFSVGLVVVDNAGNRSEYVESQKITLKKFQ